MNKILIQKAVFILCVCLFVASVAGFGIFVWRVQRVMHYRFAYRDLVRETVREMVKDEALVVGKAKEGG